MIKSSVVLSILHVNNYNFPDLRLIEWVLFVKFYVIALCRERQKVAATISC